MDINRPGPVAPRGSAALLAADCVSLDFLQILVDPPGFSNGQPTRSLEPRTARRAKPPTPFAFTIMGACLLTLYSGCVGQVHFWPLDRRQPRRDPFGEASGPGRPGRSPSSGWPSSAPTASTSMTTIWCRSTRRRERDRIVRDSSRRSRITACRADGHDQPFLRPGFPGRRFHLADAAVRAYALQKTMRRWISAPNRGDDLCLLGRPRRRRDGRGQGSREAIKWFREALNFLCEYSLDQATTSGSRSRRNPTSRAATSICRRPARSRIHPDARSSRDGRRQPRGRARAMAGPQLLPCVAQAIEAGKLFHIDLNDQKFGRFDQDLRFGSESIKADFLRRQAARGSGYDGPRHFDAHAYRTEDEEGVWDFAGGCMRTYLILRRRPSGSMRTRRFRRSSPACANAWPTGRVPRL